MRSERTPSGPWNYHGSNLKPHLFAHKSRARLPVQLRLGRPNPMSRTQYGVHSGTFCRSDGSCSGLHAMCSVMSVAEAIVSTMGTVSVLSCVDMLKKTYPAVADRDGMKDDLMNKVLPDLTALPLVSLLVHRPAWCCPKCGSASSQLLLLPWRQHQQMPNRWTRSGRERSAMLSTKRYPHLGAPGRKAIGYTNPRVYQSVSG